MRNKRWFSAIVLSACLVLGIMQAAVVSNESVAIETADIPEVVEQTDVVLEDTTEAEEEEMKLVSVEQEEESKDIITTLFEKNVADKTTGSQVSANSTITSDPEVPFDIAHPDVVAKGEVEYSDETLLVKFKNTFAGEVDEDLANAGIAKVELLFEVDEYAWYIAYVEKDANVEEVLTNARDLKKVVVAEYNYQYESASSGFESAVGGNGRVPDQKHWKHKHIRDAWDRMEEDKEIGGGSSNVTVAVIDTGVDYNHEDLKANMWCNKNEVPNNGIDDDNNGYVDDYYGYDATAGYGSAMDDNGHGTHVAGIIGASNNKTGIVGLAYNSKIMAVKAGDASGYFTASNIATAIIYAYENGADVINMSFGGSANNISVQDALRYAYTRCVLVASAGNDGKPNQEADYYPIPLPNYPAAYSFVLGVMSVDENDMESSFTNWDTKAFNGVEYEVYAPGNSILSTIPGDKYAVLSGTSMAAPVVAAQAALLRSYYSDTDTYPTKFIYGQIVGTADDVVTCINPEKHTVMGMPHNIPGRVNFIRSLEELPTPEIVMSDYTIFDTAGYSADLANLTAGAERINNEDGIVDAGEIIALGMTLRNRWGMSKNTVVTIDATSEAGVANPYVTFLNNSISYDSIGTYSESDSGKLYDEDGAQWIGWENPFYIKVAENCPNEYSIQLNVTITYENGLDENDNTIYTTVVEPPITIVVRRGTVLPNIIREDMTLTKDHYYIIPNSMVVMEGATLTIEEGTQVQFWCSDPEDAYADTAITYLKVEGALLCEGTEEEPVRLFPSEWMGNYRVEIYKAGTGYISMKHTNVVNPYISIDYAENCTFTQNYKEYIGYRDLYEGKIHDVASFGQIRGDVVKNSSFYKIGSAVGTNSLPYYLYGGTYEGNIFVDSCIEYSGVTTIHNCVFYGNNNYNGDEEGGASNLTINVEDSSFTVKEIFTKEDVGTTYIMCEPSQGLWDERIEKIFPIYDRFAEALSGNVIAFETEEEVNYIESKLYNGHFSIPGVYGIYTNKSDGKIYNFNNTRFPKEIAVNYESGSKYLAFHGGAYYDWPVSGAVFILEIPGTINISEIKLEQYVANLDLDETYQICATVLPESASKDMLLYESQDTTIATVSEAGLITPVAAGSTTIRVYAPDRAVYNYITVNVTESVIPESLVVKQNELTLEVGSTQKLKVGFNPVTTTKRELSFSSSDETVVSVSEDAVMTANAVGDAVITITGYNGITAQVNVHCQISPTTLAFTESVYYTTLEKEDENVFYPVITPANATNQTLIWRSSNPEVCYVDENGVLVKLKNGTARLRATIEDTDLSAELSVIIKDESSAIDIVKMEKHQFNYFALDSNGTLWMWASDKYQVAQKVVESGVKDFASGDIVYILNENAEVYPYGTWGEDMSRVFGQIGDTPILTDVKMLDGTHEGGLYYVAVKNDGTVWAWGHNACGQLGDGGKTDKTSPVQMDIDVDIIKCVHTETVTALLDAEGNVYMCGGGEAQIVTPQKVASGVLDIYYSSSEIAIDYEEYSELISWSGYITSNSTENKTMPNEKRYNSTRYYIADGKVYMFGWDNDDGKYGIGNEEYANSYTAMLDINNAKAVYPFNDNMFIQTTDGKFYGTGKGSSYEFANGNPVNSNVPVRIYFGLNNNSEVLSVESTNLVEVSEKTYNLSEMKLSFDYSEMLKRGTEYGSITLKDAQGNLLGITKELELDKFYVYPRSGFIPNATYTLTIPVSGLSSSYGLPCEEYIVEFTYVGEENETESGAGEESSGTGEGDAIEDETSEEIHDSIIDEELINEREKWNPENVALAWDEFVRAGKNTRFYSNVILNRLSDDDVSGWLRVTAGGSETYQTIGLGGNYWGTTDMDLINKQILDFDDYQSLADINIGEILTEAPTDTFPFVVDAYLEVDGEKTDTIGNETVNFVVNFNRPMDTTIDLQVRFGSSYPYAEYEVEGAYVTETQWVGQMTLSTVIENGYQYWSVSNGKAKDTSLKLYEDWGRFPFMIDTSMAQALVMFAEATETGVALTWTQDDFETLAGYNVYRATEEDGYYEKINRTVIPADTKEWFDNTVTPGQKYYYNFTVVESDMSESEPSGKVTVTALDTMAPDIYHSPVYHAFTGSNLVISATVTDNVSISAATLYYRVTGQEAWNSKEMTNINDKYSAVIDAQYVTVEGLEYYIEATDGVTFTYKGSAENPYIITVQEAVTGSDMGDVDGNGAIEVKDAMMLLMAINDRLNLTEVQFARADLNGNGVLEALEALRIIQYVNGSVSSILM